MIQNHIHDADALYESEKKALIWLGYDNKATQLRLSGDKEIPFGTVNRHHGTITLYCRQMGMHLWRAEVTVDSGGGLRTISVDATVSLPDLVRVLDLLVGDTLRVVEHPC